jgi:hypothetical protein
MKNGGAMSRSSLFVLAFGLLAMSIASAGGEVGYGTGQWEPEGLGNHRAVIRVERGAGAVRAHIPWRRNDADPARKEILIVDAATGENVSNIARISVDRESGDIVFEPKTVPGDYFVYYEPFQTKGRTNYPTVVYPEPVETADHAWLARNGLSGAGRGKLNLKQVPEAKLVELQSIDEFDSFYPMETIATREETARILAAHPGALFLLFPEDRRFPIRMTDDLPERWAREGPRPVFEGEAERGEFYAFQIGLWACRADIKDAQVSFSGLKPAEGGGGIPSEAFRCINSGGNNWDGTRFSKACPVEKGKVQALWCGVQVPASAVPGTYEGSVTVTPREGTPSTVRLVLRVADDAIEDAGDNELWRQSRLRWLDSKLAFDDDVVAPFTPVTVNGRTLGILGRDMTIGGPLGLPESLRSYFSPDVIRIVKQGREVLAGPLELTVQAEDGSVLPWGQASLAVTDIKPGVVRWRAAARAEGFSAETEAQLECDGFVQYRIKLTALADRALEDISLRAPVRNDAARYMMGLGRKGGLRPARFGWLWDPKNNQDALWLGDVNAGFQCNWRGENYSRPLNTNFYQSKPLLMPPAWSNAGRGGVTVENLHDGTVLLRAYSGPRSVKTGDVLWFDFNLLLTPFKPLDTRGQFSTRFFHAFKPVAEVAASGANTINVHHANAVNPYINYPFLRPEAMKAYIDQAHAGGLKVKIYYTIRELSNHAAELFGLRSLGDEIFSKGPGGGFSWLQEHLVRDYIAAWFVPELKDAAIINSGLSRWHNYYIEGLDWLCRKVGIDGLYLDDVAFDRTTMKRVRKVLDRRRPGALIDLHSANQYNPRDGYASSANLYLEHFPYLNRLWFGEYFDYDSAPDYWLVEISGIPFGLMGEMLEGGGNPWRGMVFGMTNRLPWSGNDPARLWKVWDEFGIVDSKMIGWWSSDCPVRVANGDVLATVYVRPERTMIALASWAREKVDVAPTIDWKALGLDPKNAVLRAPAIADFQDAAAFKPGEKIPVEPGKGWLLIVSGEK